jgi:hypothetical protein
VFARGPVGELMHRRYAPGSGWQPWHSLGGRIVGGPTVYRRPTGTLVVWARGRNGRLYSGALRSGRWLGWTAYGRLLTSRPYPVPLPGGGLYVFFRGTEGALWLVPVTETGRSRRRIYRITDNFLAFYLGVLNRYRAEIAHGLGESILPVLVASLDDHMGPAWEEAFRDHLRREAAAGRLGEQIVALGPWWRDDGQDQIDALALSGRSRVPVLAGEAKWARSVHAAPLAAVLRQKAASVVADPDQLRYVVCARTEVRGRPRGVRTVTAARIFA